MEPSKNPEDSPKAQPENWDDTSENEESLAKPQKQDNKSVGATKLRSWLNQSLCIEMTDKRVLIGIFQCTDRDANVILSSCCEYLPEGEAGSNEEARMLGLIMVPGKHIVNIFIDDLNSSNSVKENSGATTEAVTV